MCLLLKSHQRCPSSNANSSLLSWNIQSNTVWLFASATLRSAGIAEGKHLIEDQTTDVYKTHAMDEVLNIKTHYERIYLQKGKNINYVKFKFFNG